MDGGSRRMCFSVKWCALHLHTLAAFRRVLREMSQLCRKSFSFDCTQMNATLYFPIKIARRSSFSSHGQGPYMFHQPTIDPSHQSAQRGWAQETNCLMSNINISAITCLEADCTHSEAWMSSSRRRDFVLFWRKTPLWAHSLQHVSSASIFISNILNKSHLNSDINYLLLGCATVSKVL